MVFLDELATNATANNISIIVYSGNSDLLVSHRGSEGALTPNVLHLFIFFVDDFPQLRFRYPSLSIVLWPGPITEAITMLPLEHDVRRYPRVHTKT